MRIHKALALVVLLASCSSNPASSQSNGSSAPAGEYTFENWNACSALTVLKDFVSASVDPNNKGYIPVDDRLAVFDMDGTLYGELYPTYFEYVMYQYRILEDPAYKDKASEEQKLFANEIKAGKMKDGEGKEVVTAGNSFPSGTDMRHARLAAEAYSGMTLAEFGSYCESFLKKEVPMFNNMTYGSAFYEPMKEVVSYLKENDYNVYVVSGSDRFICRALCCETLNIASDHIIGMDVNLYATNQGDTPGVNYTFQSNDKVYRGNEVLVKNLKFNKVAQICQEIGQQPVLSFGNSGGDTAMHTFTITDNKYPSEAFMLVADDADRDYAVLSKAEGLADKWADLGFHPVSMKNDFKTIYEKGVSKKA